jgi:hypothetical protein
LRSCRIGASCACAHRADACCQVPHRHTNVRGPSQDDPYREEPKQRQPEQVRALHGPPRALCHSAPFCAAPTAR